MFSTIAVQSITLPSVVTTSNTSNNAAQSITLTSVVTISNTSNTTTTNTNNKRNKAKDVAKANTTFLYEWDSIVCNRKGNFDRMDGNNPESSMDSDLTTFSVATPVVEDEWKPLPFWPTT